MGLNVAGLFAGIGGFELGFQQSDCQSILLCDDDSAARAILKVRFPDVELVGDATELDGLPNQTDVVCAGFPCQNLSMVASTTKAPSPAPGSRSRASRKSASSVQPIRSRNQETVAGCV